MNFKKLGALTIVVVFAFTLGLFGCGKMSEKDKVMKVQKDMLEYIKSNDYKSLMTYDVTEDMLKDNAKMTEYMQKKSAEAEKKMTDKQTAVFKDAGFNNEQEFQKLYDKVKADPEVAALDKEISQAVEVVTKEISDANQKKIQEKSQNLPKDNTTAPKEDGTAPQEKK